MSYSLFAIYWDCVVCGVFDQYTNKWLCWFHNISQFNWTVSQMAINLNYQMKVVWFFHNLMLLDLQVLKWLIAYYTALIRIIFILSKKEEKGRVLGVQNISSYLIKKKKKRCSIFIFIFIFELFHSLYERFRFNVLIFHMINLVLDSFLFHSPLKSLNLLLLKL